MSASSALEVDLSWREAELGSLKLLVAREDVDSVRYRAFARSLVSSLRALRGIL